MASLGGGSRRGKGNLPSRYTKIFAVATCLFPQPRPTEAVKVTMKGFRVNLRVHGGNADVRPGGEDSAIFEGEGGHDFTIHGHWEDVSIDQ